MSDEQIRDRVRQAVSDSVRAHLVADVPVSVLLSGRRRLGIHRCTRVRVGGSNRGNYRRLRGVHRPSRRRNLHGSVDRESLRFAAPRARCLPGRIRARYSTHSRRDGPAVDRRCEHLVCQQGCRRTRLQSRAVGRWRRRTVLRLSRLFDRCREWRPSGGLWLPFPVPKRCCRRHVQRSPGIGRSPSSPACRNSWLRSRARTFCAAVCFFLRS